MNRFRKRSDAKRANLPPNVVHSSSSADSQDAHLDLPPASDFRTSLILPDLSRRFSLLRSTTGQPVSIDSLRVRLAEQRARGDPAYVLEEEEDMILDTIARLRNKVVTSSPNPSQDSFSTHPISTSTSAQSSPARHNKRFSNNLFGSNRLKEANYMRSVARTRARGTSTTPSETSARESAASSLRSASRPGSSRPITPDKNNALDASTHGSGFRSAPLTMPAPYGHEETDDEEVSYLNAKRLSAALDNVIKELEEEEDEQIVMPRSPPMNHKSLDYVLPPLDGFNPDSETGMAISPDVPEFDFDKRRASPVLSRTVPGYVPGMPRPMTPHADPDSRPGTPRATSPSLTSPHTSFAASSSSYPEGTISPIFQRSASPMFLHRSPTPNGHQIPESPDRSATASPSMENRLNRRPASPLAPNTYQPMAVPARIGTPPHLAWGRQAHNRDNSWISETAEVSSPYPESNGHSSRSLRSPPLPDSPVDRSHSHSFSFSPGVPEPSASPGADSHPDSQATPTGTPAPTFQTTSTINSIPQQTSPTPYTPYSPPSTGSILDNRHLSYQSSIDPSQKAELKVFHFKPNANSSRSSLDSTSSSYHSESGDQSDLVSSLFERADSSQTSWHDLSVLETSPANSTSISETQADEIIGRHGLKSSDFLAIQNKLFSVAMTKLSAPESLERVGSLRRRRGSTSHNSIHGRDLQRLASPPPRATSPAVAGHDPENLSRATNLLHSISTHPPPSLSALGPPSYATSPSNKRDVSPGTQRNRDLADMIFGGNEEPQVPQQAPVTSYWNTGPPQSASNVTGQFVPPAGLPVIPQSPPLSADQAELERQVLYKNNAAMIALRKRPSNSRIGEPIASPSSGSIRKKVTPQQISTPTLVSASASVDTIDLPVANSPSQSSSNPSKLGSTLKRLRGTLRAKPSPTTPTLQEPITSPRSPPAASPYTPTSSQYATYNPSRLHPGGEHPIFSATEPGRFKVPLPSPPASAGPGLKGFMSRFRGTKRETNMNGKEEVPYGYASPYLIASPSSPSSATTPQAAQGFGTPTGPALHPPSTTSPASMSSPNLLHRFEPPAEERQPPLAQAVDDSSAGKIQHLFDVASDLGVDREALNELLSRSGSTSSQATRWSKATALDLNASQFNPPHNSPTPQKSVRAEESPSASTSTHLSKSPSVHRPQPRPRPGREAQTADGGTSVVLRRTLIFPSDMRVSTADPLSNVKRSMSQKKRMSAQSHSTRSVHDRIPTPPPPAAAPVDAFSDLPPLPGSLAKGPGVPMPVGIGSGAYDSLYDSYGDHPGETLPKGLEEPGSALQVIELANGDTIWSIVNGLRDDDESLYPGRSSFASEYSYDDMQVNFKEHARKNSQGSHGSHPVRKADYNRPETKVFYSSPAQIGKLIENLSTGMDAGAFNIMPHRQNELPLPTRSRPEHSATSSMSSGADWTMEDRLEHVLQSLNGPH